MVSKLLSGYFLGADLTLGFSYLSVSSVKYTDIQRERGEKVDEKVAIHLRNILFAINGISFSIGYFLGPGMHIHHDQYKKATCIYSRPVARLCERGETKVIKWVTITVLFIIFSTF